MKTIIQEKQVFETLSEIISNSEGQITAQQLINKRIRLKDKGWSDIEISTDLMEYICNQITETLGGRSKTKRLIEANLRYTRPQHWGLDRILLEQYENSAPRFSYCAGQDYTWETNAIRRYLSN